MGSPLSRLLSWARPASLEIYDAALDGDDGADPECEAPDESEARRNKRNRYTYKKYAWDSKCHKNDDTVQGIKELLIETVGRPILEEKKAYRPGTDIDRLADLFGLELKNTPYAGVYYCFLTGKIGSYKRGPMRARGYTAADGTIIVIFYYDHTDDDVLAKLEKAIVDIEAMPNVHLDPEVVKNLSIEKAMELNNGPGPSILFRLFLHSMLYTSKESRLGGGADVAGARRALDLLNSETAIFGALKEMGVKVDDKSAMDEHLHSNLPAYYNKANKSSLNGGKGFFREMDKRGILEVALEEMHDIHSLLAWPPFKKEDQLMDACKPLIVKALTGVSDLENSDDYWDDAMGKDVTPPDGPYEPKSYKMRQHLRPGFVRIEAVVVGVETSTTHVFKLIDSNMLIMLKVTGTTMVEWLLGRALVEEDDEWKWEVFYTHLNVTVMILDKGDDIVRMLFVVGPLCYMLFAGAYKDEDGGEREPTDEEQDAEAMRAEEAQFLIIIFDVLRCDNSGLEIGDISPPLTIWRNPLWAFITKEFMKGNIHLFRLTANLWPKSLLGGCNALDTQYHRMPASKYGLIKRQQTDAEKAKRRTTDTQMVRQLHRSLLQHLSGGGSPEMTVAERRSVAIESTFEFLAENTSFWKQRSGQLIGPERRQEILDTFLYYYFPEKDNEIRVAMNGYLKQLEAEREDVLEGEAKEYGKRKQREADDAERERQRKAKEKKKRRRQR